jgi:hypothetical protein
VPWILVCNFFAGNNFLSSSTLLPVVFNLLVFPDDVCMFLPVAVTPECVVMAIASLLRRQEQHHVPHTLLCMLKHDIILFLGQV